METTGYFTEDDLQAVVQYYNNCNDMQALVSFLRGLKLGKICSYGHDSEAFDLLLHTVKSRIDELVQAEKIVMSKIDSFSSC